LCYSPVALSSSLFLYDFYKYGIPWFKRQDENKDAAEVMVELIQEELEQACTSTKLEIYPNKNHGGIYYPNKHIILAWISKLQNMRQLLQNF
jgi:hypothetical protein